MNKVDKIVICILQIIFFITPFSMVISLQLPVLQIGDVSFINVLKDIFLILICLLIIYKLIKKRKLSIDNFSMLIISFVIYGVMHIFISNVTPIRSINKFRTVFLYPIVFTFICLYVINFKKYKILHEYIEGIKKIFFIQIMILICGSLLEMIMGEKFLRIIYKGYYERLHINLLGQEGLRLVSFVGNPINLSLILCVGLAYFLFVYSGITRYFLIPLIIAVILLSFSRTSYLIAGIIILIYIIYSMNKIKNIIKMIISILGILIFGSLIFNSSYLTEKSSFVSKRVETINIKTLSENIRVDNWNRYLNETFKDNILYMSWGGGLGTSNSDSSQKTDSVYIVENSYISILGEMGIIGLVFYLTIIIITLKKIIKLSKYNIEYRVFLSIYLGLCIGSGFNDLYVNNPFSQYFWIITMMVNCRFYKVYLQK
ncbi:MAG: O-antigen ligase family protein [Clostridium paraputrificum]|uniref:O-antigen ligase family protein n=1 Tax=Clostridium paraputrificum TaxID=29363 RepID=UPI000C08AC0C|nr:O-antigen ligase family protein [Clostridium paraputrificum]MDB2084885.1 O-antigen ligase family protein [Clostridium paraputrificum]SQB86130.1 lipid A core-O-antigen ligase-like enyme [Clostridium paraputrificum]